MSEANKLMAENRILKVDPAGRIFTVVGKAGKRYDIAFTSDASGQQYAEGVSDEQLMALLSVREEMRKELTTVVDKPAVVPGDSVKKTTKSAAKNAESVE